MQSRQLLDRDAARRSMAAVARGCLIKLYELTNLSSYKGETPHQRSPGWLPHRQDITVASPGEDSPKELPVRLHPDEGLIEGDGTGDM